MTKLMTIDRLRQLLSTISPDNRVMPNEVGNLSITSPDGLAHLGYVDFSGVSGDLVLCEPGDLFGTLAPHQVRVIAERAELVGRIDRLEAFLCTDASGELPIEERDLLGYQLDAMQDYRSVLDTRIGRFEIATTKQP